VRNFAARSHAAGLAASSVQRRLSAVRSFMKFLVREGVIPGNPAVLIKAPKGHRRLLTVLDPDPPDGSYEPEHTWGAPLNQSAWIVAGVLVSLLFHQGARLGLPVLTWLRRRGFAR